MITLSIIFMIFFGYFFMAYLVRIGFAVMVALASLSALFIVTMGLCSIFGLIVIPIVAILCFGIAIGRRINRPNVMFTRYRWWYI